MEDINSVQKHSFLTSSSSSSLVNINRLMVDLRGDVNKIMKGDSKVYENPEKGEIDNERVLLLIPSSCYYY